MSRELVGMGGDLLIEQVIVILVAIVSRGGFRVGGEITLAGFDGALEVETSHLGEQQNSIRLYGAGHIEAGLSFLGVAQT